MHVYLSHVLPQKNEYEKKQSEHFKSL